MAEKRNTPVTPTRNIRGVGGNQWFLEKARKICEEGEDFDFTDFREISRGNFRQLIYRNKDKIVRTNRSTFCSYKLKGYKTRGRGEDVTLGGMGVGSNMEEILRSLRGQPAMVHDLKIKLESDLHSYLKSQRFHVFPSNKRISLGSYPLGHYIHANISVYPKTVHIDVGCSRNAIIYDTSGALNFLTMLGRLYQILFKSAQSEYVVIPEPLEWMITNYHFNRDGKNEYSGELFHRTVGDFTGGFVRWYTKKFPDGKTRIRQEKIMSVNRTVEEECNRMMNQDMNNDLEKSDKKLQSDHPLIDEQIGNNRKTHTPSHTSR